MTPAHDAWEDAGAAREDEEHDAPIPARPVHAAWMAAIHAAAFPPPEAWGADALALQLGAPGAFGFLDARGGLVLARAAADEAEILTLAVAPFGRRRGVARGLLRAAMAEAARRGAAAMFLEVSTGNEAARALYAGRGFREAGRRARYYPDGADALVLRACLLRLPMIGAARRGGDADGG